MPTEVKSLNVPVNLREECRLGDFANAFRVLDAEGPDCLLEFLVYSALENQASVVSRIRVRRDFLPVVRDQLDKTLTEIFETDSPPCLMASR